MRVRKLVFILLLLLMAMPQSASAFVEGALLGQDVPPTATYNNFVITSTPNPDGSIIHIVQQGENLWSIAYAYGMTMEQIQINTGNSPLAQDVYQGQTLIIRKAFTPTPTSNHTPTPTPITPQPTVVRPTRTPIPTSTPQPTPTPTLPPPLLHKVFGNSRQVGSVMAGVSVVGLLLLLVFGFLKKDS